MAHPKWNWHSETPRAAEFVQFSPFCSGGTGPEGEVPVIKREPWASCESSGALGLQAFTSLVLAATFIPCVVASPTWFSVGS